ncbi:MAG: ATP-binding protein [Wenzhouxiangella sp.]
MVWRALAAGTLLGLIGLAAAPFSQAADSPVEFEVASTAYLVLARERLERGRQADDGLEMAIAHHMIARNMSSRGQYLPAKTHIRQAIALLRELDQPLLSIEVDNSLAAVLARLDRGHEATHIGLDALQRAESLGDIEQAIRARLTLSTLAALSGAHDQARKLATEALVDARNMNLTDWQARLKINLVRIAFETQPDFDGEPWLDQLRSLDDNRLESQTRLAILLAELVVLGRLGQDSQAIERLTNAWRSTRYTDSLFLEGYVTWNLATLLCERGDLAVADALFRVSLSRFERTGSLAERGRMLAAHAHCLSEHQRDGEAFALLQQSQTALAQADRDRQADVVTAQMLAYNSERQRLELERLEAEQALLHQQLSSRRWQTLALVAFSALLVALSGLLWSRSNRLHQQKHAERALAQTRIDLLARTSHEIRNPVQGLIGQLEKDAASNPGLSHDPRFGSALAAGRLIDHLARDYLDLALIQQQKLRIEADAHCRLSTVIERVRMLIEGMFQNGGETLVIEAEADLPDWVRMDSDRLIQVLLNAIINGFKHGDKQAVRLTIRRSRNRRHLVFCVRDQGPGFASTGPELFNPYWSGGDPSLRGSGLGLAVSAEIVQRLGGDIRASNPPEGGAELSIRLPLIVIDPHQQPHDHERLDELLDRFKGVTLAVVDDDEFAAMGISAIAGALGCTTYVASNATELEALLAVNDPDVLLIDQRLGQQTGLALASLVRRHDIDHRATPRLILMVSGGEVPPEMSQPPFDAWCRKPLAMRTLAEHIARHFEQHPASAHAADERSPAR